MTAIKKHAIELIMNLPDEEIRAILAHDYNNEREFLEALEE